MNILLLVIVVAAFFGSVKAFFTPAGKCITMNDTLPNINYAGKVSSLVKFKSVYVPDVEPFTQLDQFKADLRLISENKLDVNVTQIWQNSTITKMRIQQTAVNNTVNAVSEDAVDTETGKAHNFRLYTLALIDGYGMLIYRCSEDGGVDVDTRFIVVPRDRQLTNKTLQQLMDVDRSYHFRGGFHKLPYTTQHSRQ